MSIALSLLCLISHFSRLKSYFYYFRIKIQFFQALIPTASKDIHSIITKASNNGQAFVLFRLPDVQNIQCIIGAVSRTLQDGETAFAFAPFDPRQKPYYIKPQPLITGKGKPNTAAVQKQKSTAKKQYTDLVKNIVSAIRSAEYKKIVAARLLAVKREDTFDPFLFFQKLCNSYPSAFVSFTCIPGVGMWIGASPEILVSGTNAKLTVFSLAGTKAHEDETDWTEKEKEEQQIVTDFIYQKLSKVAGEGIKIKGPVTHNAGKIKHLLSVFTIAHKGEVVWQKVVKTLHPTPAVAGVPQLKSMKFVSENESFDRAFYAGYLGPVNLNGKTNLFVNLRCMQVTDSQLLFYAGCGITADSDPQKEWLESERKIDILKSLI